MNTVREWPHFLLRDIPPALRDQLSQDATTQDLSISDVIRRILCDRYKLNCPPRTWEGNNRDQGATTFLLRLQPELKGELFLEAEASRSSVRGLILDTLTVHYNGKDT